MASIVSEIISILVAGISGLATGIGEGLNDLVTSIFVTSSTSGTFALTTFGGLVAVFGGIALAIGLSRLVVKWVMSLGGKNY